MGCRGCRGAHRPCSIQHTRGGRRWEDADGEERAADRRQEPYYPYVPGVERSSSPELRTTRVAVGKRRRGEREESDDEEEVEEEERDELEEDDVPRAEELQVGSSQVEELEVENTVEVVEASPRRSKRVRTVLEIEDAAEVVEASPDRSKRVRMASPEVTQVVPPMEVEEEETTQAEELRVEGTSVEDSQVEGGQAEEMQVEGTSVGDSRVESDQAEELQVEGTPQMSKYSLDMRDEFY